MISILFNTLCGCTQMCNMFYSCSKSQEQNGTINDINIYIVLTIYNIWWGLVMNRFF